MKPKELTKNKNQADRIYDADGISVALKSNGGGRGAKTGLYAIQNSKRFQEDGEESFTLTSQDRQGVLLDDGRMIMVRKLTPKECFRLQGWTDDYYYKASFINSDSQLYKQAGNGVTVSVIKAIAEKLE